MKYIGCINVIDDQGNVVYERELTTDEIIERLLALRETSAEIIAKSEQLPEPPVAKRTYRKKDDSTKHHGKTLASESRRKSWNSDEVGAKKNGSMTGRVKTLYDAGKSDDEISAELGIGKPAIGYHKKKLGLTKERIPGRMQKKEERVAAADEPWDPEPTESDITQIWEIVDMGIRDYPDIAKRAGVPVSVVKKVLLKPRP